MELIDFEKKGNAVRLYFGKNGKQTGDDWDDSPYECNAETVYPEYVKKKVDIFFPIDVLVEEPADTYPQPNYRKDDFVSRKTWALWIQNDDGCDKKRQPVGVWFGDTLEEIEERLRPYEVLYAEVEE